MVNLTSEQQTQNEEHGSSTVEKFGSTITSLEKSLSPVSISDTGNKAISLAQDLLTLTQLAAEECDETELGVNARNELISGIDDQIEHLNPYSGKEPGPDISLLLDQCSELITDVREQGEDEDSFAEKIIGIVGGQVDISIEVEGGNITVIPVAKITTGVPGDSNRQFEYNQGKTNEAFGKTFNGLISRSQPKKS